jgi:hypothetical protein
MFPHTVCRESRVDTRETYISGTVEGDHRASFLDASCPDHGQNGVAVPQLGAHLLMAGDRLRSVSVSIVSFFIAVCNRRKG